MIFEGVVTAINHELLSFELDYATNVYMVLRFCENAQEKLPILHSTVKLDSAHYHSDEFIVFAVVVTTGDSLVGEFNTTVTTEANNFIQTARIMNLMPSDLVDIDCNYRLLKTNFEPRFFTNETLIIKCVDTIGANFKLQFLKQVKYVDNMAQYYKTFAYWTYGNHWRKVRGPLPPYLIAYLFFNEDSGRLCLTDFHSQLCCTITNTTRNFMEICINNYVLIRDYVIFTEVYNSEEFASLTYLLVDQANVMILNNTPLTTNPILQEPLQSSKYMDKIQIVSKSTPTLNTSGNIEFWLEIIKCDKTKAFLCLNSSYLSIFPLLSPGCEYELRQDMSMKRVYNREIAKLCPNRPQHQLPPNASLIPNSQQGDKVVDFRQFPNVLCAIENLKANTGLVSFQGILITKKFVKAVSSRTARRGHNRNFGTPGTKTHLLEFMISGIPLTVYLNNWENLQMPHCLIPQMRLIVHNVLCQKGKYLKSTAMTSFEIVGYEPKFKFETANLCRGERGLFWGRECPLGAGAKIPVGVIIWGRVISCFVLGLKIKHQCCKCLTVMDTLGAMCGKCHQYQKEINVMITLIVKDEFGESKILAKDSSGLLLLRLLLGCQENVFKKWLKAFDVIVDFQFSKRNYEELLQNSQVDDVTVFKKALSRHLKLIENLGPTWDLKCRKMADQLDGKLLYFLLDARRCKY